MHPQRLRNISIQFPKSNYGELFLSNLLDLLQHDKVFIPKFPVGAIPTTEFSVEEDIEYPQVVFDTNEIIDIKAGNFHLKSSPVKKGKYKRYSDSISVRKLSDGFGKYFQLTTLGNNYFHLPIDELMIRFRNHIVRLTHTGVNIPTQYCSEEEFEILKRTLGSISNIYNYPNKEPWPFILPSTEKEFQTEITDFQLGREPSFELVLEEYSSIPILQIDIETDLEREEVEKLLPEPYGMAFPGLQEYFRSVFIYHGWRGMNIRFDLRYKNDDPGDWDTGKWLVEEQGRIKTSFF